jgi:hypothetical protein
MTGRRYATGTDVPTSRSRDEIERTVARYGATAFAYGHHAGTEAFVGFTIGGARIRLRLPLPDPAEDRFRLTSQHRLRTASAQTELYEAEIRRLWRALALVVKAKLEAIAAGITTLEEEFGMHMLLPDGRRIADVVVPQLHEAIGAGGPLALTGGGS